MVEKKIGKHAYKFAELSAGDELNSQNVYRQTWRRRFNIGDAVVSEGERLAACAFMIKEIDGKAVAPIEAFEHVLSLRKMDADQIRLYYIQINENDGFFGLVEQLIGQSSDKDSSFKNTEGSAGTPPEGSASPS